MKPYKYLSIVLFISSVSLIFLGSIYGKMQVYLLEAEFWRALLDNGGSTNMADSYMKYINILKGHWSVLSYLGVLQLFILILIVRNSRSQTN
jgi:hypothetical protein